MSVTPLWGPGVGGLVQNVSSVSPVCRKRQLNGVVSLNNCKQEAQRATVAHLSTKNARKFLEWNQK